uniref:Uncharacterized protein n=1 Tax=Ciona savignyi TaxID=51511 RepID=H2YS36_CIOSA
MTRFVTLVGGSPWGFRLVGGSDFRASLAISKITPGGKADNAGLQPGDVIMAINGNNTSQCTHLDAQNLVKSSQNTLTLKLIHHNLLLTKVLPMHSYADPRSPNDQRSPDAVAPPKGAVPVPKPTTFKITATIPSVGSLFPTFLLTCPHNKPWQPSSTKSPTSGADDSLPPPPPPSINQKCFAETTEDFRCSTVLSDPPKPDFPPPPTVTVPVSKPTSENGPELYCEGCKQQIRGPYLTAQGKNWHPDEFVCASPNCGRPLQNVGFIEEKGQRYCSDCYEKYFAHSCAKCHKKIVGVMMHALNQTWHVTCFVCTSCNQPFRDGVFHLEHDKPYCVADYNKQFGTLCKGCGFAIEAGDHFVEAIKSQWHESCFTCAVCHIDLKNAGFYSVNNKPVCSNHKNARL